MLLTIFSFYSITPEAHGNYIYALLNARVQFNTHGLSIGTTNLERFDSYDCYICSFPLRNFRLQTKSCKIRKNSRSSCEIYGEGFLMSKSVNQRIISVCEPQCMRSIETSLVNVAHTSRKHVRVMYTPLNPVFI